VIEEIGDGATGYEIGQRVMFATSRLPENFPPTWMGAHVGQAIVPSKGERAPLFLPEGCDPIAASLSALPAVSLRGINMLNIKIGDLVVVIGQGLIGQGSAQLARLRGATVVVADINAPRLALSKQTGADVTVNIKEEDLNAVVRAIKPAGADVIIETTGRADQFAPCINLLRGQGQLLMQGWYPQPITFDFHATHGKRPTIAITCGFDSSETAQCLTLMSQGKLRFAPDILGVVFDWSQV
jgi:threonine dehydrogenase-like Zn-dependent dehydrogenase